MTRTTPPRPLDVEALFPELAAYRGTTTRLHPRPGSPDVSASSVGGPMLWPADEPWPVCEEAHGRGRGRRPADIHHKRQVLATAWAREPFCGLTDDERQLVDELSRTHRIPEASDTDPLPLVGLAQLYRRDIPDLPAGPDDCDLRQVFWCPFDAHGAGRHDPLPHLRWRRSAEVGEPLAAPPEPQLVGYEWYVPEPCVLHPEQVATYPFAGLLPEELCARLDAWDEAQEDEAEQSDGEDRAEPLGYQYDLSIPPGWRVGGFASWHRTDPYPMNCLTCATPMNLLLTVDSTEWDEGSGSWTPLEERGLPPHPFASPTEFHVGRSGELNFFTCPVAPGHPHRWSLQ
ncbi:hypothetical protein [Streptomyces sp. MUM 178J]|uniref:hypothetical protein n=1 Tax=Streptomyces sp. MUM 178J TaxID=2791991 RepID=UPI001F0462CE|nr:hypothetical protein [Streptomyces sp. MUM 178J]WRQ82596.1 hypothetical protein I3F59_026380 [Streptomyces sp. MUM 178J]